MTTTATKSLPSSATVNFRLAGGSQPLILVPVYLNGDGPLDFILDTGAGTSLVSPELAKRAMVKIVGSKDGQSAGGKVAVSLAQADTLAVGKMKFEQVDLGVVDLSHIGKTIGTRIDGDLGYNFLRHFRVTIDYETCKIRLEDPKRVESVGGTAKTEVPIRLAHPAKPLLLVEVHINGAGPFQFAIDTGTSTTALAPHLVSQLKLKTAPMGPGTTAGAAVAVQAAEVRSFEVGGARLDQMAVVIGDFFEMLSQAVGTKLDGIVGYNFLRHYKVVIDYPNEKLSLH